MAVINTNYLALVSQNNLNKSQGALGTAIERLSSGLRINSAKDDAAGQAIANRFTANIRGLSQAARNANDGISIAQTTEGALNEINENLQRVRELTVQAANGTNSESDLESIQAEINQRMDEINRVSEQTQFNGVKVLASSQTLSIQVGAHDAELINVDLQQINRDTLELADLDVTKQPTALSASSFEADVSGTTTPGDVIVSAGTFQNGASFAGVFAGQTTGSYFAMDNKGNFYQATVAVAAATSGGDGYATGDVVVTVTADQYLDPTVEADATTLDAEGLMPLKRIDAAIAQVDALRSDLGAVQNRFESTIANLSNTVNNLSAARSRIEDADYAVEVSNMTRAQILQQAGTAVLAQANQVPQTALSLLR